MNTQYPIFQEPPKSNQEAFDRVWNRFIRDKQPRAVGKRVGAESFGCAYRTEEGLGCAIGCQIPDALYSPTMENNLACLVLRNYPAVGQHFVAISHELLGRLQQAHDDSTGGPEQFAHNLRNVAQSFNLTIPAAEAAA